MSSSPASRPSRVRAVLAALAVFTTLGSAACVGPDEDGDAGDLSSASTEAPPAWTREADLARGSAEAIRRWFDENGRFGEMDGTAGVKIRHVSFEVPRAREKAALVFFQGRTESYLKYAETTRDLTARGYSVYLFDHRGQGLSGRLLPDRQKGHVDAFANYVTDAKAFVDRVVARRPHAKVVGIGHSMGGAILTSYAMKHPDAFAGVVLASPMHKMTFPMWAGGEFGALQIAELGTPDAYAVSQGPYDRNRENDYSTSSVRWGIFEDLLVTKYPEAALGGVTNRWLVESIRASREIREQAGKLVTPTLLLQPTADEIVDAEAQDKVCRAARRCRTVKFEGAKHELFIEADTHRSRALDEIVGFVDALGR